MAGGKRKQNRQRWRRILNNLQQKSGLFTTYNEEEGIVHQDDDRLPAVYRPPYTPVPASQFSKPRWFDGVQYQAKGSPAARQPEMTWEMPKEEKIPQAKACKECKRCDHCGQHHNGIAKPEVVMSLEVLGRIKALMRHFSDREWLGYLVADERGVFTDIFIPKQVGYKSTVEVDRTALTGQERIDGVIHSHHTMGAFHSGTDDEHLISNHPVSLVASVKSGELKFHAVVSLKLECGALFQARDADVTFDTPDQRAWVETVKDMVAEGKYQGYREVTPSPQYGGFIDAGY